MNRKIRRGDIFLAILNGEGSQQTGKRPVVIYSNDQNNTHSPVVNVLPITSEKRDLCVHVFIDKCCGLENNSVVLTEQITTINKYQLIRKVGKLEEVDMERIDRAIDIQLGRNKRRVVKLGAA